MRVLREYLIGSRYFFGDYPDYGGKDNDRLCVMEGFPDIRGNVLNLKKDGDDIFLYRDMDKEGFITDTIGSGVPMRAGKFLIPEFCESISFTINDLRRLDKVFGEMDEKHSYERVIYEAYLVNGGFFLTEDQRDRAYRGYKAKRGYNPHEVGFILG